MSRGSFKDTLIKKLTKRAALLEKQLERYNEQRKELQEIKDALKSLGGSVAAKPSDPTDLHYNPENQTPLSEHGLKVYARLSENFSTEDLAALMNNDRGAAYQWVAAWKRTNRIDTVGRGNYRKLVP